MSRSDQASVAVPVLAAGTVGGLVGSLFCFCWLASLPAGYVAVRSVAKAKGGRMTSGTAVGVGVGTGLVLGMVTASLGTAFFVASLDPAAMEEAAAMSSSFMGEGPDMSAGLAAAGHAMLAFGVNLVLGVIGAVVGATSLPPVSDELPPEATTETDWRFEPPAGWSPEAEPTSGVAPAPASPLAAPSAPVSSPKATVPEPPLDASKPPQHADDNEEPPVSDLGDGLDDDPPTDPRGPVRLTPESAQIAHDEIPSEAFVSAWRSKAAGGTPVPAPKQAPPSDEDEVGDDDAPTQGVPAPKDEGDTL